MVAATHPVANLAKLYLDLAQWRDEVDFFVMMHENEVMGGSAHTSEDPAVCDCFDGENYRQAVGQVEDRLNQVRKIFGMEY